MFPRSMPEIVQNNGELRVVRSFSVFNTVYDLAKDCAQAEVSAGWITIL